MTVPHYTGIIAVLALIALLALAGVDWLAKPETLPIKRIELLNQLQQIEPGHLQNVASKAIIGGFFSLDLEKFRGQIESLAWVESVSIRKKWPDTIQLSIHERTAVARWFGIDGINKAVSEYNQWEEKWDKKKLLSDKGVIFDAPLNAQQLVHFSTFDLYVGPDSLALKVLGKCQEITARLVQAKLRLNVCGLNQRRAWNVEIKDAFSLRLGRGGLNDMTAQRTEDFVKEFNTTLYNYVPRIAHVDMRYTNGFTVGWKDDSRSELETGSEKIAQKRVD